MGIFMLGGGAQKQVGGDEGGGFLASKLSQNLICIFVFCFSILTDNFLFLWDYGLAKKNYIKSKNALDKLYISVFTQLGSKPSEVAPHSPMVKFLFMLQVLISMWINFGSGLGGAMAAASSAIGPYDENDSL